jgi:hypothetical protein
MKLFMPEKPLLTPPAKSDWPIKQFNDNIVFADESYRLG